MDEILRWGTQDLFTARSDSEDALAAVQSGEGDGPEGDSALREDPENAEGGKAQFKPCQV